MSELKPCPFCGSSAEYAYSWIPKSNEIAIRCSGDMNEDKMGCPASNSEQDEQGGYDFSCYGKEYLPKLIEKWNSRPIEDQLKAENDKLRAENEQLREALNEIANFIIESGFTDYGSLNKLKYIAQQALKEVTK